MDNVFTTAAKRDLMRAKMRNVVEHALYNAETSNALQADRANYETIVRQEFAALAEHFAKWDK